jgi:uncharacterized membrane protein (DUF106 family)
MWYINVAISSFFNLLIAPFRNLDPLWSLTFMSLLVGILMLVIFRYTSNQGAIRETKNKIRAYIFELRLFKDELSIVLSAQKKIFTYNMKYMSYALKPMLFMMVPLALVLIQLEGWYGFKALIPQETAVVSLKLSEGGAEVMNKVTMRAAPGLEIDSPALRIPSEKEVNWRIRAKEFGSHNLTFNVVDYSFNKEVVVSDKGLKRVTPASFRSEFWNFVFNPGEKAIPNNPYVEEITVSYPINSIKVYKWGLHWLVVILALSIVFGFALKGLFKVEI